MPPLNARGHEILDTTPVERPVGFKRPPTLQEQIRTYIKQELSQQAAAEGQETWEEAEDFEVGDDVDPRSPFELDDDQEAAPLPEPVRPGHAANRTGRRELDPRAARPDGEVDPDGDRGEQPADLPPPADGASRPVQGQGGPARRRGDVVPPNRTR